LNGKLSTGKNSNSGFGICRLPCGQIVQDEFSAKLRADKPVCVSRHQQINRYMWLPSADNTVCSGIDVVARSDIADTLAKMQ
jgi:hypothetical protein